MILNDLVDLLEIEEYGTAGEDIFYNYMIDEPDNVIVVTLLPGQPFIQKMTDVHYNVQITVRNTDYDLGYEMITTMANKFHDRDSYYTTNPNNGRKMRIRVNSTPSLLTIDNSNRAVYTLYLIVTTVRD